MAEGVLKASVKLFNASITIAIDPANKPKIALTVTSKTFPRIPMIEVWIMLLSRFLIKTAP